MLLIMGEMPPLCLAILLFHRAATPSFTMHCQWQPGMRVSGTMVANGKRVSVTIHPDGTTEESEASSSRRAGGYRSVSTSGPGGTMHTVHLEGGLGENLASFLLPEALANAPLVGPVLTTTISWVPTLLCGYWVLKCVGLR